MDLAKADSWKLHEALSTLDIPNPDEVKEAALRAIHAGTIEASEYATVYETHFAGVSNAPVFEGGRLKSTAPYAKAPHRYEVRHWYVEPLSFLVWAKGRGYAVKDAFWHLLPVAKAERAPARAACHFPMPSGASWKDVRIRFQNGQAVSVTVGKVRKDYLFLDFGLATERAPKPDVQWKLLRQFSEAEDNEIRKRDCSSKELGAIKQRVVRLSTALKEFFGLQEAPIEHLEKGRGWRTVFRVEPDSRM